MITKTTIHVSPKGEDQNDGAESAPLQSLARARDIARALNGQGNVEIVLHDGVHELAEPLALDKRDGGNAAEARVWSAREHSPEGFILGGLGTATTWRAADGARPVISGGSAVTGWRPSDVGRGIYEADIPKGRDSRQLWINGERAPRASMELPRDQLTFSEAGIAIADSVDLPADALSSHRLEVNGLGHFTDRWSPVESVDGRFLQMQQPAWAHNNWGFDTLARPIIPEDGVIFLVNSLGLLTEPGEWFLDPEAGRLYVMPAQGIDLNQAHVVLPRLDHLISISGTENEPLTDLHFTGLQFSHTTWMRPSSSDGYANQQSGTYLTGPLDLRPADALDTGYWGCPGFESLRNKWSQIPAAVQVSAAARVTFRRNVFTCLGQVAIGIGMNGEAHASGTGLGAQSVEVSENLFTEISGAAIMAGGVEPDAHHPRTKGQHNANLIIRNNRIHRVSQDFKDNAAILCTYVTAALILNNEISETPYDAIAVGWGWGMNDGGINPSYMLPSRPYYQHAGNLVYDTGTTHRDVFIAYNKIHDVKTHYRDGGAIYNLSASPGTVIAENHLFNINKNIGLYLDEGSRHITLRNNVVEGADPWLFVNALDAEFPRRISTGNRAIGNWHDTAPSKGQWTAHQDNLILDDHTRADGQDWPEEARAVIEKAGIEPTADVPEHPAVLPNPTMSWPDADNLARTARTPSAEMPTV